MAMNHQPKPKSPDADLIAEFLKKGGKITKCKTKPMPDELGISNVVWGKKLTKVEKDAKHLPLDKE